MLFRDTNFFKLSDEQRERDLEAHRNSPARYSLHRHGMKPSFSANDLSYPRFSRDNYHSPVRAHREMNETSGSTHASTDALTSIPGHTSPALSWIDGGVPLNSPMTIAGHETAQLKRNLPSMPDLTRMHMMSPSENIYQTNFSEQDPGIFRALSAPRLSTLEENYRAKFLARDLDNENGLFQDMNMGHRIGEPHNFTG